ncbi:MAG: hypothetical protein KDB66_09515, partial [Solirubrobacterales bacterium]|nr:hypothetical protein [Solirubrobacterales bacterium]
MMMLRNAILLLLVVVAAVSGPAVASAADEPATSSTAPTSTDTTATSSNSSTDSAPLTLTDEQINDLSNQQGATDDDKSVFEKASDFITENAPWFIIGIIVLAAIIAGILIMRGRPRKSKA